MIFIPEKVNRKGFTILAHYTCSEHNRRQRLLGEVHCDAKTYHVVEAEAAVVAALVDATQNPGVIAPVMEAYWEGRRSGQTEEETEREIATIQGELDRVEAEQAATVQGRSRASWPVLRLEPTTARSPQSPRSERGLKGGVRS